MLKKILIIDDDAIISGIYRNKFLRLGFAAEFALDGQEGLKKIEEWKPDLVILDLMLPKVDGLSLLRTIRANAATRNLPIVVYSNTFSKSSGDDARELGVAHMLSKSDTRPNQLMEIVSNLLGVEKAAPLSVTTSEEQDRTHCLQSAKKIVAEMRALQKEFFSTNDRNVLIALHDRAHTFGANAWIAGLEGASHLAEALQMLLKTLCEYPKYITFSTDKTLLQAIECLESLANNQYAVQTLPAKPAILVVDDQEVALKAASMALNKARLPALCVTDPLEAVKLLSEKEFDLVLLDISMPNMDGMELCARLRNMSQHYRTPVVFFSQLSEIGHRIDSSVAGGNDFIGKPFLAIELTVKALYWLLKQPTRRES
jgi:CheY-like chemotaxis protein